MKHLRNIKDIGQTIADNPLCLFYIKAPECGVCNVMLDKVWRLAETFPSLCSFYTDITEEPLIAGRFQVYSGPTVLLLMEGKEVYRGSQFIDMEELKYNINRLLEICPCRLSEYLPSRTGKKQMQFEHLQCSHHAYATLRYFPLFSPERTLMMRPSSFRRFRQLFTELLLS